MKYVERSKCMRCGKVRYRKYMEKSGEKDVRSQLDRWQCKVDCGITYKYGMESTPSHVRRFQFDFPAN